MLRRLLLTLALLSVPAWASAQITLVDTASTTASPVNLDCTGTNRVVYVWITYDNPQAFATSVTYNGDAMTKIAETAIAPAVGTGPYIALYVLVAPDSGTAQAVADPDNNWILAACYSGVDQSTPNDTPNVVQVSAATTVTSGSISSATGDLILSGLAVDNRTTGQPAPTGGSQTELEDLGNAGLAIALSSTPGTASTTTSWSWGGASRIASLITVNLNAAGGGGGGGGFPQGSQQLLLRSGDAP